MVSRVKTFRDDFNRLHSSCQDLPLPIMSELVSMLHTRVFELISLRGGPKWFFCATLYLHKEIKIVYSNNRLHTLAEVEE